jgi:hypothetical protein
MWNAKTRWVGDGCQGSVVVSEGEREKKESQRVRMSLALYLVLFLSLMTGDDSLGGLTGVGNGIGLGC